MEDFKSDIIATSSSEYASLPTGAIVQIAGNFSKYSTTAYEDLGLLPCDGRSLNASSNTEYLNLYNVIGVLYGGSGSASFNVPNLKDYKVSIVGTSNTFYNTNTVGTRMSSLTHSHNTTATNNNYGMNAGNTDHYHNMYHNGAGNMYYDTAHAHYGSGSGTIGANVNKYGAGGTSGGGLNGNHSHNVGVNSNGAAGGVNNHTHGASNHNIGNVINGAVSHTHTAEITTSGVSQSSTVNSSSLEIPYANMLYFIRI